MENIQLKNFIKSCCMIVREKEGFITYEIKTKDVHRDEDHKIQVMTIGPENEEPIKSVLLLGQTGAGKTCVINAMINFLFGVDFDDNFRFQLKDQVYRDNLLQVESQTEYITAYIVYHQAGMAQECNYMLIDTPGFGNTRENEEKVLMERVAHFLKNDYGINDLNCIALVTKANENRISVNLLNILEDFTSVFESNIGDITQLLATFASDDTSVIEDIMNHAKVQFVNLYQLDNYPLYASHCDNASQRDRHVYLQCRWDRMQAEYSRFFNELQISTPVSLKNMRDLRQEEKLLEETKTTLMLVVKHTADLITTINFQKKALNKVAEDTNEITCTNIEVNRIVEKSSLIEGFHAHNCEICLKTCINFCEDSSNRTAALAGTGTGVGTAAFTGVGSAVGAGALMGAEVGVFGGPVGVAIGGGIGTVIGLTAGLTVGLMKRKTSTRCPIGFSGICSNSGCSHDMALHKIEKEKYVICELPKEKFDHREKLKYDDLMDQMKELETKIEMNTKKLHDLEKELTTQVIALVKHTHKINELGMRQEALCPKSLIDEIILDERKNSQYVELLQMLKRAVMLMLDPQGHD
ncbi:uncharacterized protein [Cherax quadricarinatus]|nr:uncharacterized protein LOC128702591 [Cherax quadricarinatus]XP_053652878.1 uncharacterized protein LOC128702591 [Cherax quadricarinatus]XP_053652886.1 uncharacterized protein LOC128702591 [Cherax quadricarinatus]